MDESEYRRKMASTAWFGMMICGGGAIAIAVLLVVFLVRVL
jgi:hypothetical protein